MFIRETPDLSIDEKKRFFKSANTNLGQWCSLHDTHFHLTFADYVDKVYQLYVFQEELPLAIVWPGIILFKHPKLTLILDHFGVVKAFLDANLLPRVITGTSAGPCRIWLERLWRTGARFDSVLYVQTFICTYERLNNLPIDGRGRYIPSNYLPLSITG